MSSLAEVAVLGASGFAGRELCGLIAGHSGMNLGAAMSSRVGVQPEDPLIEVLDIEGLSSMDLVFVCTPHMAAAPLVRAALERGAKVVDLSADFRLKDLGTYTATYGAQHQAPDLVPGAVYGLTEHARVDVTHARLVANPGCYPTASLLALKPLLEAGLIDVHGPIIVDAKSGLSGAGRSASQATHFANVHENFRAYNVGEHRHAPEISQEAGCDRIVFTAHLLPLMRGILATIYVQPVHGVGADQMRSCLSERYAGEAFVEVLASGVPELCHVQRTNQCHIGVVQHGPLVTIVAVIDNLLKGAAGQALQNANLMLGFAETAGLQ